MSARTSLVTSSVRPACPVLLFYLLSEGHHSTCFRKVTVGRSLGPRPRWGRQAFGAQWRDMGAVMHMPVLTSASDGFPVPLAAAASFCCDNPMSIAVSACVVVGRLSGFKEHVMALPPVPPGG
jgi:hypothetical protein